MARADVVVDAQRRGSTIEDRTAVGHLPSGLDHRDRRSQASPESPKGLRYGSERRGGPASGPQMSRQRRKH